MNKIRVILTVIISFILIGGFIILNVIQSYHKITVSDPNNVSVLIYNSADIDKSVIKTFKSDTTVSLKNGKFCTMPINDDKYDDNPICFNVKDKAMSITVNPNFSTNQLAKMLPSEINSINNVINKKYAGIIDQYTVLSGKLYGQGQWYGTTLTKIVDPSDRGDTYRVLLKKDSDSWKIIAYPQISISKYDYPQVPFSILSDLNKQLGNY